MPHPHDLILWPNGHFCDHDNLEANLPEVEEDIRHNFIGLAVDSTIWHCAHFALDAGADAYDVYNTIAQVYIASRPTCN